MKKKLVAIVALAAMLLTMLPFAAFADDSTPDINIEAINFNNNTTAPYDNVIVRITGSDVRSNYKVVALLNGDVLSDVSGKALSSYYVSGNEYLIYIPKSAIPDIDTATANNVLAISIVNSDWSEIVTSKSFTQSLVATMPQEMEASIDTGSGNTSRTFTIRFDGEYVPDEHGNDRIVLQGVDEDGDAVGTTRYVSITSSKLSTSLDGKRVLTTNPYNFDSKAESVEVSFERNGEEATAFTTLLSLQPPYGELKSIEFDFGGTSVARGATLTGKLYYVNTKNERTDITDEASYLATAPDGVLTSYETDSPSITVAKNAPSGSVTVMAFYGGKTYSTVLTVVDPSDGGVKLDKSSALINQSDGTAISIQLLDKDGKNSKLDFTPTNVTMKWVDSSAANAKATFYPGSLKNLITNGTMLAAVNCDTACSGKFALTFSDDNGRSYTVTTDTFTFTEPSSGADKVTVTIGSTTMQVDGKNVAIDAPPIIDNGRTYVPLRAIGEAFGADVDFDDKTNLITIDLDDTHITMTPYRLAYTVNGVNKTMDVAPYISAAYGRTMVPARFIAEALGFDSSYTENPDGTTHSATFTAK